MGTIHRIAPVGYKPALSEGARFTESRQWGGEEAKPTIDVVVRLAKILDTTVGYLLGESEDKDLLKDPAMLKRLNEIEKMDNEDKSHILHVLDGFIKSVKLKNIAAL
ncbi:MAG: hypothetical protein JXA77_06170 [Bacteroidales bacterium]|nr:hypothetical protein [Bacteroidales bacterium]MBN2820625.1 hypothetical protein [Bacteroidales bacterium]